MDDREYESTEFPQAVASNRAAVRPASSPLMFWCLTLLASAVFAPCVLVPVMQDHRAMLTAGELEARAVGQMEADVARQRRHANALRQDPMVISRIARRELAYTDPAETTVALNAGPDERRRVEPQAMPDVQPPAVVAQLLQWMPAGDRLELYRDPAIRSTLMALSAAVMVAAFLLFPPRRRLPR